MKVLAPTGSFHLAASAARIEAAILADRASDPTLRKCEAPLQERMDADRAAFRRFMRRALTGAAIHEYQ
jgi:hypothetical protein